MESLWTEGCSYRRRQFRIVIGFGWTDEEGERKLQEDKS